MHCKVRCEFFGLANFYRYFVNDCIHGSFATKMTFSAASDPPSTSKVFQSYEPREFDLLEDSSESELGQRNDDRDIRDIVTSRKLGNVGLRIIGEVRGVDYGTWNGARACAIKLGFQFRRTRDDAQVEQVDIHFAFNAIGKRPGAGARNPVVRDFMPGKADVYSMEQPNVWNCDLIQPSWLSASNTSSVKDSATQVASVKGEVWPQGGRREPWAATWKLFNNCKDGSWRFEDEIMICVVVEWEEMFQGAIQVSAVGEVPGRPSFVSTVQKIWSRDDPLFFNQKTTKGKALPKSDWKALDWSGSPQGQCVATATSTMAATKSESPKVKKRPNSTTYRVKGIPHGFSEDQARDLIEEVCNINPPDVIVAVHSLAKNPHRQEAVATVVFSKTPPQFEDEAKDEWRLRSSKSAHDVFFDVHFQGFTPVADSSQASVDVITVSGLGGHAFGSFKERGGPHMWIRDSLLKDLPTARILLYGHDSHLSKSSSFQTLSDLGKQLQVAIHSIRNYNTGTSPERPIIFLGQSLGGLLISQALVLMSGGDASDQANFKATYGIVSFGTPNRGLNVESLVAMVENQPNRYFLETLRPNSEVLDTLRRNFLQKFTFRDSEILSIYELQESLTAQQVGDSWKMTGPPAILVDRHSAMQGRSWEQDVNGLGLNKDHSGLAKFHRYEEEYEWISSRLQTFAAHASKVIAKRFSTT